MLVAYQSGRQEAVAAVSEFLFRTGMTLSNLNSTLGRTATRALETQIIAEAMEGWLGELENNLAKGNRSIFQPWVMPAKSAGFGLNEAPRGALGHWIDNQDKKIGNYQRSSLQPGTSARAVPKTNPGPWSRPGWERRSLTSSGRLRFFGPSTRSILVSPVQCMLSIVGKTAFTG
jgi:[NiFe] hydrogenase large subunit